MRVISVKKLREFWEDPQHPNTETSLRAWYQVVKSADWTGFNDVRNSFGAADLVKHQVVFDVAGNNIRLIAVIDYEGHKVFVRYVLDHKDYDKEQWKKDEFGKGWTPRPSKEAKPEPKQGKGRTGRPKPGR